MANPALNRLSQQLVDALVPESRYNRAQQSSLTSRIAREIKADVHGGARKEWEDVRSAINGLSRTAKVRVQDDLAEALIKSVRILEKSIAKGRNGWEGDEDLKISNLPQYVHLLLNLSDKPTSTTHDFAYSYLHRIPPSGPTADQILYREIMNSEPFDPGETWSEEVLSGWSDSEDDYGSISSSEESEDSPEEDYVKTPSSAVIRAQRRKDDEVRRKQIEEERREEALEVVRGLKDGYWNKPGEIQEVPDSLYGWKALITQTSTASLIRKIANYTLITNSAITSVQLQREILFALSGRSGIIYTFSEKEICSIVHDHPQVYHLTPDSLNNVIEDFKTYINQAASIRKFITDTLQTEQPITRSKIIVEQKNDCPNRTQQAFAGACQKIMSTFDLWLSDLEASFTSGDSSASKSSSVKGVSAASTTSLLSLEIDAKYSLILELITSFIPHSSNATILLNLIYTTLNTLSQTQAPKHISTLRDIFVETAKLTWQMLGIWLQHGMPIPSSLIDPEEVYTTSFDEGEERLLEVEFFIKRDRDVSWADEDFYESGFTVNEYGWPIWIGDELGESILEAGKARGLLKSLLGSVGLVEDWQSLEDILGKNQNEETNQNNQEDDIRHPRQEEFSIIEKITNHLKPMCQITQFQSRRVLDNDCGLEEHLDAIEGLMYHRGFEVLHDWSEVLFDKVLSNEKWQDFQTLTSAFRDTVEEKQAGWMNSPAIRIRTVRSSGAFVGPRALEVIRVNYEVPFPLSQLFSSTSIELRAEVFTFLLQLRMGQYILNQTKRYDRDLLARVDDKGGSDIRAMWRMRQKLLWFIETIYIWLTDRIIEVESRNFRRELGELTSLKTMISLELEYTRRIRNYAFLHPTTSEIYETIQNIFDLIHTLWECYESYNLQLPPSKNSQTKPKPRAKSTVNEEFITRRRPRNKRKKTINYSSDEDEQGPKQFGKEISISFAEIGLGERMTRIENDLNDYIYHIKNGVETLSVESQFDKDQDGWSILSFALEEWK